MTDGPTGSRELIVDVPGTPADSYDVRFEAGGLGRLGEIVSEHVPAHRYAVIADSRVAQAHGETAMAALSRAGADAELFTFPAGEWNKTREVWAELSDRMLAAGFGRDAVILGLGGGVTGDLAGFAAATYMRGVPVVQVPTSLLAMLDSSVGGKTGVDTGAGKNLVGAFHHPRFVLIDTRLLSTLPRLQRSAGLAEAVKTAAILDEPLLDWLEANSEALLEGDPGPTEDAVRRVLGHKASVVSLDPGERGRRAILNFGHTVGHAIELLGGYEILHGEAVAAGMRAEAALGERLGVTAEGTAERLAGALEACALDRPLEHERPPAEIWEAMRADKKRRGGELRCVFLERPGSVARAEDGEFTFELAAETGAGLIADVLGRAHEG